MVVAGCTCAYAVRSSRGKCSYGTMLPTMGTTISARRGAGGRERVGRPEELVHRIFPPFISDFLFSACAGVRRRVPSLNERCRGEIASNSLTPGRIPYPAAYATARRPVAPVHSDAPGNRGDFAEKASLHATGGILCEWTRCPRNGIQRFNRTHERVVPRNLWLAALKGLYQNKEKLDFIL